MTSGWTSSVAPRLARILAAVLVLLTMTAAPGVMAEPSEPGPAPPGDALTLTMPQLGSPAAIPFDLGRNVATSALSFAVPRGFTPVELRGRIEFPVKIRYGNLTVRQGDRTLARIGLPPEDQADVVLPLTGVAVTGTSVNLSLSLTAIPLEGFCWDETTSLVGASIVFTGAEQTPTTVSDFLPAVLRKVTIAVPPKPSRSESEAAIQLAAALATHNSQAPDVVVVPLPDAGATTLPLPAGTLERRIVVKEGPVAGIKVQADAVSPSLLITGSGEDISTQARLFNNEWSDYAISAKVDAQVLPGEQESLPDNTTVGDITTSGLTAQALQPEVVIYVDQTRFGHPLGGISVHLIGSHTPVPDSYGGEVVASIDGQVVDRWASDASGTIDRTLVIPARLVKRVTNLSVALLTSANTGKCGDHIELNLRIDPQTSIQVSSTKPFMPQGFQSFPQALSPHVLIGLGADALGDTARAAQIVAGLRRTSRTPLVVEVTDLKEAIAGKDSAVLVSGGVPIADRQIPLPFTTDESRIDVTGVDAKGQSVTLTLDPGTPFASLQTATSGDRSLLIATSNGAPRRLDELLRWANGQPGRWAGLDGRAVIAAPGREPLVIPNPPAEFSDHGASSGLGRGWLGWALGAAAVVGVAALARRLFRRAPRTVDSGGGLGHAPLAGAARIDASSADSAPALTHQTGSPDLQTGIVKGQVIGSDPGGDTLTYSAQRTSSGGGVLDIDAETGDFTFTPTQAQRHAAAESTTDTFIVTAHCGVRTAERTVTVAVDPGIPVAGAPSVSEPNADTAVVTGSADFTDTAGRALTYTAAATSAGGGAVVVDAETGRFVYTPAQAQRDAATESTTDTFIVTAHNGVRTADQVITVMVLPIRP